MKTIFELIDDVSFKKPDYEIQVSDDFVPFMVQKWLSFASPEYAMLINNIHNTRYTVFSDDRQALYNYLRCILPKKKLGKINYMKKASKKAESKNADIVKEIAELWEMSVSDAKDIVDVCPEILEEFKDKSKVYQKS